MFQYYLHKMISILRLIIKIWVKTILSRIFKTLLHCFLVSNTAFEKSDAILIPSYLYWCTFFFLKFMRSLYPWCLSQCLQLDFCTEDSGVMNFLACITISFSSRKLCREACIILLAFSCKLPIKWAFQIPQNIYHKYHIISLLCFLSLWLLFHTGYFLLQKLEW